MAKIRCGRGHYHNSVAEVRACYNGETVTDVAEERTAAAPAKPTEKQMSYAESLLKRNGLVYLPGLDTLNRQTISGVIDALKSGEARQAPVFGPAEDDTVEVPGLNGVRVPKRPAFDPETLDDGFYMREDNVYKVIVAVHGSGRKYAKVLSESGTWEMAPGAVAKLRPEHKMTLEQALKVAKHVANDVNGALYGRCFKCGRVLTNEDSIERFMGPVCAESFS